MQKKLTILIDETVYHGLHAVIGRGNISKFLEALAKPFVSTPALAQSYQDMADDPERESLAEEWSEHLTADEFDASR
jgi:hypothetical protein